MTNHMRDSAPPELRRLPPTAFLDTSCELLKPLAIFMAIYSMSNGIPCAGCAYDMHGKCKARQELFAGKRQKPALQQPAEPVRDMAKRLNISLSEARRRRRTA